MREIAEDDRSSNEQERAGEKSTEDAPPNTNSNETAESAPVEKTKKKSRDETFEDSKEHNNGKSEDLSDEELERRRNALLQQLHADREESE